MTRAPVSVVLPTRDRAEHLRRSLPALRAALGPDDELFVVDSASVDAEVADVAARFGQVVRCELPGVDRARNAGWRRTRHDVILFVDDDVVVDEGWADAMAACFAAHPEAAFVTGRIDVPEGQEGVERPVAIKDDEHPAVLDAATTGVIGHSASLGVRRSVLDALGGFDEALGAGGRFRSAPEVDLFDRIFAAGLTGRYEPAARAWHDQWRDTGGLVRLEWRYGLGTGARLSKLARTDRQRARVVARDQLWDNGAVAVVRHVGEGYQRAVVFRLAFLAGAILGAVRASLVPVVDGHFASRSPEGRTLRPIRRTLTSPERHPPSAPRHGHEESE